ncbi:hypothetical protein TNCV_3224551 [Trichonephila clavipes]|nr:hypothetical protein TNCV_3224551 [Trichonephila clavipes]
MLVRPSRLLYYLARPETQKPQLFSCTPHMAASLQDHLTISPKVLKSSKPRSKCQISQEAVRCVIIPKVKNIRHNFIPLTPGRQDFKRIKLGQCPLSNVGLWSDVKRRKEKFEWQERVCWSQFDCQTLQFQPEASFQVRVWNREPFEEPVADRAAVSASSFQLFRHVLGSNKI